MSDTHTRSVAKTLSWRVIATLATMALVFMFTGQLVLALGLGVVDVVVKMLLYYGHERVWNAVRWGKK